MQFLYTPLFLHDCKRCAIKCKMKGDFMSGFGIYSPPPGGNPDDYAAMFAKQNGISIDRAKELLRAKYGDPNPPQNFMQSGFNQYYHPQTPAPPQGADTPPPVASLDDSERGVPAKGNPDEFAQKYADEHGMTLEQAKAELKTKHNDPVRDQGNVSAQSVENAQQDVRLSKKDKKEWIKSYMEQHGCSKKEAKEAFKSQFEYDVMSRKEAMAWVKNYMAEHNCKKSEAKAAFKEKFGYDVPLSTIGKVGRMLVAPVYAAGLALGLAPVIGVAGLAVAGGVETGLGIGTALSLGPSSDEKVYHQKA